MSGGATRGVELPEGVLRLFPHHDPADVAAAEHRPFLFARLLEDGDSADLRWLAAVAREDELAAWLAGPGAAKLSRRSAGFWSLLLAVEAPRPAVADELWPL